MTVANISTTGIGIHWQNLVPLINGSVLYYIALISHTNVSFPNAIDVAANTTFANFRGLSPYTDYLVNVIAVGSNGQTYRSSSVTVQTDEGGTYDFYAFYPYWLVIQSTAELTIRVKL